MFSFYIGNARNQSTWCRGGGQGPHSDSKVIHKEVLDAPIHVNLRVHHAISQSLRPEAPGAPGFSIRKKEWIKALVRGETAGAKSVHEDLAGGSRMREHLFHEK